MNISILSNVFVGEHVDQDPKYFWANIQSLLNNQDVRILNPQTSVYQQLNMNTRDIIKVINAGNIDLINMANPKTVKDNGKIPLTLNQNNIHTVGIGINDKQAHEPFEFQMNNIKIGVIGFSTKKESAHISSNEPSIFYTPFGDVEPIKDLIHQTKKEVDVLIALIQWGSEKPEPNDTYQQFAHSLIDEGVDIIHGESDHVYLGVENYNNKLIMYDSGDFVDIYMSNDEKKSVPRSFVYELEINKDGLKQAQLIPVLLQGNQLVKATDQDKTEAITLMQTTSKNLGATISHDGEIIF